MKTVHVVAAIIKFLPLKEDTESLKMAGNSLEERLKREKHLNRL